MHLANFHITNKWILDKRGVKNTVNPHEPFEFLVEQERMPDGNIEDVATIFLTNKECPFRCLMCDLWKNTIDEQLSIGLIPQQIEFALERLPTVKHIKLYNSGNFFDPKAIPLKDYDAIIQLLNGFETVLVENHPKLTNQNVVDFRDKLKTKLQVALGLETVHPQVLPKLNKQMTLDDFGDSIKFLEEHDILSRAFILLRPPFLNESEGIIWAKKSMDFAFDVGVECCVVIPTRTGNGAMDELEKAGLFHVPKIHSLEEVLEYGISLQKGRVFVDLWDLEYFSDCDVCLDDRRRRLNRMNVEQIVYSPIQCICST